jgi:Spy/CpxP family protein refolding chaperone
MSKRWKWSIVWLSVSLLAAVTLLAQNGPARIRRPRPQGVSPLIQNEQLQKELGLNADQVEKLRQLRKRLAVAGIESRSQLQIKQLELRDLIDAKNPDRAAIDKKVQEISVLKGAQMKGIIDMRLGLQEILTPEQMSKVKEMRGQAVRRRVEQLRSRRDVPDRPGRPFPARRRQQDAGVPPVQPPKPLDPPIQ